MGTFLPSETIVPLRLGEPNRDGIAHATALTINSPIFGHRTMVVRVNPTPNRVKELTTIQLTTETRDRLYRLKFRKTYDEFLRELSDLFERSENDQK